jgi:hypothetical protein
MYKDDLTELSLNRQTDAVTIELDIEVLDHRLEMMAAAGGCSSCSSSCSNICIGCIPILPISIL